MARTPGTARLSGTIEPLAGGALDARDVVQTKADLTAANSFPYPYIGMETYVVAENKKYRLVGADPTVLANWEEIGSGGGGSVTVDTELSTTSENPVQNKVITTELNKAYKTDDSTFTDLADGDYVPVYDSSASTKKRTLWSNIKSVLKTYFDTLYKLTAGDGIVIEDDEISTDNMPAADMSEIVTPLPSIPTRYHKYSTEEQIVGEWIDGKPLYQKTIQAILPEATGRYATLVSLGTNCFIQYASHPIMFLDDKQKIYSGLWGTKSTFNFGFNMKPDGTTIVEENGTIVAGDVPSNRVGRTVIFNVWYTKTTD